MAPPCEERIVFAPTSPPWREYRKRWRITWLLFFLGPLGWVIPGSLLIGESLGLGDRAIFFAVVLPFFLAVVVTTWRAGFWPCPRCSYPFHATCWYNNPLSSACVHCGLPKGWLPAATYGSNERTERSYTLGRQ